MPHLPQISTADLLAYLQHQVILNTSTNSNRRAVPQLKPPTASLADSCVSEVVQQISSRGGSPDRQPNRQPLVGIKKRPREIPQLADEVAHPLGSTWSPDCSLHALYFLGPELGAGQYGVVRVCLERSTGSLWACKSVQRPIVVRKTQTGCMTRVNPEIEIFALQRVAAHPHVIHLHSVHRNPTSVYLVMDLCAGGDMLDYTLAKRQLSETLAACVIAQVASALSHCSRLGVMHRDVKLENILIAGMLPRSRVNPDQSYQDLLPFVQLADFGLSTRLRPGQKTSGRAGSTQYMSPEMVLKKSYGANSDVWSLGVCLYIMLTGYTPFNISNHDILSLVAIQRSYENLDLTGHNWSSISPTALHLVNWMLDPNPETRANIEDVLNHPWLLNTFPRLTDPSSPSQPIPSTPQHLLKSSLPSAIPSISRLSSTSPSPSPSPSSTPSPFPFPSTCTTFLSPTPSSSKRRKFNLLPTDK